MTARRVCGGISYGIGALLFFAYLCQILRPDTVVLPATRFFYLIGICLFVYIGTCLVGKTLGSRREKKLRRATFVFFFLLYLTLLFTFVWWDDFYGRRPSSGGFVWELDRDLLKRHLKTALQLEPFGTVERYVFGYREGRVLFSTFARNILGNLAVFIPLGFFLPVLWKKQRNLILFFLSAALLSCLIEGVQLALMIGVCDIDDVILNTAGALLSYGFFQIPPLKKKLRRMTGFS